jgi:hypothetical protein
VGDHTSQTWVVAAATNDSLDELIRLTCEQFGVSCSRQSPGHWRYESLLFTTPEGLTGVVEDRAFAARVPAIILVDPTCMVYQARRGHGRWRGKDRPQHIADYRAAVCDRGWSPPFFVWTQRPAKSISSLQMESAFCVSGWWFLDGRSLRTGPPPGRSGLLTGSLALCL